MSLLGLFAWKNGAARLLRRARAGLCCRDHARCAGAAVGSRARRSQGVSLHHMSLLARTPHGSVREGVLGLAARRDGSGRDSYAFGPIAFKLLVYYDR